MFSKLRVGARKVGGRKERPASRDGTDSRLASGKGNDHALPAPDLPTLEARPGTSGSKKSFVASSAPILPPIPRIASQASRHEPSPVLPTIETVGIGGAQDHEGPALSPSSQEADFDLHAPGSFQSLLSTDRTRADFRTDRDLTDAALMPPPASRASRSSAGTVGFTLRSRTASSSQSGSSRHNERPHSSQGSSHDIDVPSQYRLDEPRGYITPATSHDMNAQGPLRPKSRLTRLNPLSYLSRKRHSQVPIEEVDNSALQKRASFTPFQDVSKTFDPRIIGEGVHDFSAPRPSQYMSIQDLRSLAAEPPPSGLYTDPRRGSDSNLPMRAKDDPSPERRHVPVFRENFSDSAEGWRLDPQDRRNRVSTNIVDKVAALEKAEKEEKRKSNLPAFAQHMPHVAPGNVSGEMLQTPPQIKVSPRAETVHNIWDTPNSIQETPDSLKPPKFTPKIDGTSSASPLADRSYAPSPDTPHTLSSLPRHLRSKTASVKSQASRFSFDMIGSGSAAQEKMLEERHRQRAAQRARAASMTGASINEEDDFDDEDLDFDDGLEEDIPGMHDEEDYHFNRGGLGDMTLDALDRETQEPEDDEEIPGLAPEDYEEDEFGTEEFGGGGLGNMTLDSIKAKENSVMVSRHMPTSSDGSIRGLGLRTDLASTSRDAPDIASPVTSNVAQSEAPPLLGLPHTTHIDPDDPNNDFYFDDGEFDGEFGDDELQQDDDFDESFLDKDFTRGKLLAEANAPLPTTYDSSQQSSRPTSLESDLVAGNRHSGFTTDTSRTSLQARRSSAYGQHSEAEVAAGFAQNNLEAYHNALAFAANQAAMQGRFDRKSSGPASGLDPFSEELQQTHDNYGNHQHPAADDFVPSGPDDDFDFEDSLDDEAIIAAANAEALENDDEGFYGQEFGFYAHAGGSNEVQSFHGGFFGPGGMGQVKRSHSGRADFQEPSLTPITERSEWSNRNSMISLAMYPAGGMAMQAAGLAQLADQMQHDGSVDDMSLGALMRARRSAFGGSSTSLPNMGSRSGSPSQYLFPQGNSLHTYPSPVPEEDDVLEQQHQYGQQRSNSALGISSMTNPLLSLQTQNLTLRPTTSGSDSSPLKRSHFGRPGHSRNSSSAESVSYQMERDEDGGNQWVLERRRTLDNGETEILGREFVQGTL